MGSGGAPALSATRSTHHPYRRLGRVGWSGKSVLAWVPLGFYAPVGVLWWSLTGEEVIRAIRTGQLARVATLPLPAYRRGGLPRP
jgi:hypothetical protein